MGIIKRRWYGRLVYLIQNKRWTSVFCFASFCLRQGFSLWLNIRKLFVYQAGLELIEIFLFLSPESWGLRTCAPIAWLVLGFFASSLSHSENGWHSSKSIVRHRLLKHLVLFSSANADTNQEMKNRQEMQKLQAGRSNSPSALVEESFIARKVTAFKMDTCQKYFKIFLKIIQHFTHLNVLEFSKHKLFLLYSNSVLNLT